MRCCGKEQTCDLHSLRSLMDRRVKGERSDAVLRMAMPGDDIEVVASVAAT
jgi:hypothetical protein